MMAIDNETVMRELTRMCLEQATQSIAQKAREFSTTVPAELSPEMALIAFADAIESTNSRAFPKDRSQ